MLSIGVLVWLPVEDPDPNRPLLVATSICLVLGTHFWRRVPEEPCRRIWLRYPLAGLALGVCTPLLAAVLMLFKSGLHGHGFPDYLPQDYLAVLRVVPLYGLAGFALGLGAGARRWQLCRSTPLGSV